MKKSFITSGPSGTRAKTRFLVSRLILSEKKSVLEYVKNVSQLLQTGRYT